MVPEQLLEKVFQGVKRSVAQVEAAFVRLHPRERQVINLYYGSGLSLKEVGVVLTNQNTGESGVSAARASQLLRKAKRKLIYLSREEDK